VVLKTSVERGSPVAQGASLVQLDRRTVAFSEQEARANLHSAEAQQALAAAQGARNEALAKKGAISKDEWERVSSQCRVTHAAATAAQARAQMALKNINDSDVRAPFAGVVDERYVNLGEYVQPASRVVTLVELDPLRLQFSVGEREVSLVKVGQSVDFKVQAYGDEKFSGEVRYISAKLRSASRDVVVEAVVKNLDGRLHPGTFVSAQLHLGDRPQVAVPSTAVIKDGELSHVFAAAQGHVEMRLVQPGMSKADWVVIADGLQAGDQVVAVPDPSVRDGASID
jgi:membrane fusion protein (multidrug efflux system)